MATGASVAAPLRLRATTPLMRGVGAFEIDAGRFRLTGGFFSLTTAVHATQPSKRTWNTKLTNGKKLMSTSAMMPSSVK